MEKRTNRNQVSEAADELFELSDYTLEYDYWCDGTAEADAKQYRLLARNLVRSEWKAAKRRLLSLDTAPSELISHSTFSLILKLAKK